MLIILGVGGITNLANGDRGPAASDDLRRLPFIVAAIVPCSAFGALGYSIVGLGGWGAATFWGISVLIACGLAVF